MIAGASVFGMGVGKFPRPLRGVGVQEMPDSALDTARCLESVCMVPLGAGVLRLLVPGVVVRVIFDRRFVADGVEVPSPVIPAMRELFKEDEGVEF
jgi:hypothetical protein